MPPSSAAEANRIEEDRFKLVKEEQERMAQYGRALKKRLRTRMQAYFHNTKTLPMDLFRAFQKFDKDASGFIDFSEFENVRGSPCLLNL
jgi:Ca2+-binding EF-hand superfamily protein